MSTMTRSGVAASKVPEITLVFWVIKIAATTLGETGGDAVSMTLNLGYAISSGIYLAFFIAAVSGQLAAHKFYRSLYWATIVATTTLGTTMADFADRSLGIGYPGGSLILFSLVMLVSLGVLAADGRHGRGQPHHFAQGRGVLLGGDPLW